MLDLLLAQLVAPPVQNSPVRLPGPDAGQERPGATQERQAPSIEVEPPPAGPIPATPAPPNDQPPAPQATNFPTILGLTRYSTRELDTILAPCRGITDPTQQLETCAATLTARLVKDGYVNTRVYAQTTPSPGFLNVVEGRVVELRVNGKDLRLNRRVAHLISPLKGAVLHLPGVERDLRLLNRVPGITSVRGSLSRLGSDVSQAVLTLNVEPGTVPWRGEVSLRNDGSNGSGEARATGTLVKGDLATEGDTFLVYGEVNTDDTPSLGALITSISYTYPLGDQWNLTGAFGYSRRNLIELPSPADEFSSTQFQGLGQLEWVFKETLRQRWSLTAGGSWNRSNTFFAGKGLDPTFFPEAVRAPQSGYLRLGLTGTSIGERFGLGGNAYLLQGIGAATPAVQRSELDQVGIRPGEASALGAILTAAWGFAPGWQLNLRAGGQIALNPLTSPMQFTLGSDVGLRGLPGQLISGDSGLLGTGEVVWTFWRKDQQALQLVPFIGAGAIRTDLPSVTFDDTVGAGGVLARWIQGDRWILELGWVSQFETDNNGGEWNDWLLGDGLYGKATYRF